jgi:hypothetical protein
MKEIPLTQGKVALVDDADYDWLMQWKWWYVKGPNGKLGYAQRMETVFIRERVKVRMHRLIMGVAGEIQVDHINGNTLDNQRINLRLATNAQNCQNAQKRKDAIRSKYKGVSLKHPGYPRPWSVEIKANKKRIRVGSFAAEIDAAKAYDAAALIHHGQFARLNFPEEYHP